MSISGLLFKKRGGFGKHLPTSWQERYFVLNEGILNYYEDEDHHKANNEPRGFLDMMNSRVEIVSGSPLDGAPNMFTIQLVPVSDNGIDDYKEKWKLCANGKDEQIEWLTALCQYCDSKDNADKTPVKESNNYLLKGFLKI